MSAWSDTLGAKFAIAVTAVTGLLLSPSSSADVYCGGDAPVLRVLTYGDGAVLVQTAWRGDFLQICNLEKVWKGVAPGTCFAWMSKIASGVASNKRTGFWYGGVTGSDACRTLPTYGSAPAPVYVDLVQ